MYIAEAVRARVELYVTPGRNIKLMAKPAWLAVHFIHTEIKRII